MNFQTQQVLTRIIEENCRRLNINFEESLSLRYDVYSGSANWQLQSRSIEVEHESIYYPR